MPSVSICISLYNNVRNFKNLIDSIRAASSLRAHSLDYEFLVYNDGSTTYGIDKEAKTFCSANHIRYLSSRTNKGISYSWNALCEASGSEIVILLNDDLRCSSEDWIEPILFLFSANERLGIVYWCQRIIDPTTGVPQRLTTDSIRVLERKRLLPVIRHNFCGAFFAIRKSIWQSIKQPDNSIGFWTDLVSYGEEFDLSAETLNRGYFILQLPILWDHFHSQTFKANPEKRVRAALSPYLSLDEFKNFLGYQDSRSGVRRSFRNLVCSVGLKQKPKTIVTTLDYSMAMLDKKWRDRSILGFNGSQFLAQMRKDGFPRALHIATETGSYIPPKLVTVYDQQLKKICMPWQKLMDNSEESLL